MLNLEEMLNVCGTQGGTLDTLFNVNKAYLFVIGKPFCDPLLNLRISGLLA